jgi:class I fructose-bisphosphate aldolase
MVSLDEEWKRNNEDEARAIRDGGGFGSIIGRNSFQRKKEDALNFLGTVMGIYEGSIQ